MEAHPTPAEAKCDKDSVIDFVDLPQLLDQLERIHQVVQ
jgi:3-deoxy-D-manno-octulosonic acid (KDO) 8-phosphate synthase